MQDRFMKLTKAIFNMKITKTKCGDILFDFKRLRIWFYPHRRMDISRMIPKTIIKGVLYKSKLFGTSYLIDLYFFKISWKRVLPF